MMDLSVITITYNSRDYIDDCILSVFLHSLHIEVEHIIVDNNSSDGTYEHVSEHYSKKVKCIQSGGNLGFSRANQLGCEQASGRYFLFLNPDMKIVDGLLDELVQWMDKNTDVGIATCKLLTHWKCAHPALYPTRAPTNVHFFKSMSGIYPFAISINKETTSTAFDENEIKDVETVRGSFLLLRADLPMRFDTDYFLLLEDIDLCLQVRQAGYRVTYLPLISCIDFFNGSFTRETRPWYYLVGTHSMKYFLSKWYSKWHLAWFKPLRVLGFLCRVPKWGFKKSITALLYYQKCIKNFHANKQFSQISTDSKSSSSPTSRNRLKICK